LVPLLAAMGAVAPATAAEPRIEFSLATESGLPVTSSHQWLEALQGLGLSRINIRAAQPRERPEIKNIGSEDSPIYEVTGIITRGGALQLPGGSFQRNNKAGIAAWIEKVKEGRDPTRPIAVAAF